MTLDKITKWSSDRSYRFSDQKTVMVIFQKKSSRPIPFPNLQLQNFKVNRKSTTKFLGLTFDSKSASTPHIKILKAKCLNTLNILKYLSHPHTGCSRKLLLQLYNSLIQLQLDYSMPIYSHINKSSLKLLDTVQSSGLRLALGDLRTSPTVSLCVEAGVLPLSYHSLILTANFLTSTAQYPNIPIFSNALCPLNSLFTHFNPI